MIAILPPQVNRLVVAVSGGVDSVVLLHLLVSIAQSQRFFLQVAHLDHRIRPESRADADFVRELCEQWQLPCRVEECDVPELAAQKKVSLEMAGRNARREFLHRIAGQVDADFVALAHHRDDQVETFMLRLLRGSGQRGLAAMQVCQQPWWRPLLNCSREQIIGYARHHQLHWVEDESNRDPAFLRNRVRQQLMPQLREINPRFDDQIAALTHRFQQEENYWREQVAYHFNPLIVATDDGLRLSRKQLLEHHPALRLRLIQEALRRVRGDLQRIEAVHLHAVEELLAGGRSQAQIDLPGCWIARRYATLWIRSKAPVPASPYAFPLPLPGAVELPSGQVVQATIHDELEGESPRVAEFSAAEIDTPIQVRSWRPVDRFEPQGMTGRKKLKNFFSDNRVEHETRAAIPLLVAGETILWVAGMRRSRHAVAGCDKGAVVRVELL